MSYKLEDNSWADDAERDYLAALFEKYTKKDDKWIVHRFCGDPLLGPARWIVTTPDKDKDRVHCYTLEDVEWLLRGYYGRKD